MTEMEALMHTLVPLVDELKSNIEWLEQRLNGLDMTVSDQDTRISALEGGSIA